jgi:CRP-like cAMP-binding protein
MALTIDEKLDLLRKSSIFVGLGAAALLQVAEQMRELEFPTGQLVAREGDMGTGLFLIVTGQLRVIQRGVEVAVSGAGEFVGEMSIVDQAPRVAHLVAVEPTSCLGLASWEVAALLREHPSVANGLRQLVDQRHRERADRSLGLADCY